MEGNREYKSSVFSMLLEDPVNALQVYNAINGSDYDDPEMVEICVLDGRISLSVHNDASFLLDAHLSIYEHQSTVCPNMPVRSLIYFTYIVERLIKGKNIYGHKLVKIPTPRFVVFYNGDEEQPEQYEMKLSDSFTHPVDNPEIELVCKVYNINYGKNKELLDRCQILKEYMIFVDYVREYNRMTDGEDITLAIERAIDRCIKEGVLKDFLIEHREEVVKVVRLDYTFDRQIELERIDSREEGFAEGREEGLSVGLVEGRAAGLAEGLAEGEIKTRINLIRKKYDKGMSSKEISELFEYDLDEVKDNIALIKEYPDKDDAELAKMICDMRKG